MPAAEQRILVVGDVMTDVIVRPEGPLARGLDRRAKIRFGPRGLGPDFGGVGPLIRRRVDFVARVGG